MIWLDHGTDRQAAAREQWPELFAAIDDLIEQVDADAPPFGSASKPLYGRSDEASRQPRRDA